MHKVASRDALRIYGQPDATQGNFRLKLTLKWFSTHKDGTV